MLRPRSKLTLSYQTNIGHPIWDCSNYLILQGFTEYPHLSPEIPQLQTFPRRWAPFSSMTTRSCPHFRFKDTRTSSHVYEHRILMEHFQQDIPSSTVQISSAKMFTSLISQPPFHRWPKWSPSFYLEIQPLRHGFTTARFKCSMNTTNNVAILSYLFPQSVQRRFCALKANKDNEQDRIEETNYILIEIWDLINIDNQTVHNSSNSRSGAMKT